MTGVEKREYSVFYRTDRDCIDDRHEFKTSTKTWDADDFDMRMLVQEIADHEFQNCDGWEWWGHGDVVVFFLYAPEVEGGEPGGASIGNFGAPIRDG